MPRGLQVNYEDVWKEVSMAEFQNINPSTEYAKESIKQLAILYRDAQDILRNPPNISPKQIQDLRASSQKLKAELDKQIALVRKLEA